jgi:GntR family transcriptional regulator
MDFPEITGRGKVPKYRQIADAIEAAIRSGELSPSSVIPSEQRIMDETGAARGTVRHAVALLRERGLVWTRPHLGTFVSAEIPPPDRPCGPSGWSQGW